MSKCGIGLYVINSVEAVSLYKKVFGLELGYHVLNDDGSFFHSELCENDEPVIAVVEANAAASGYNPVQLGYTFESAAELTRAFGLLSDGGNVLMAICSLPWSDCAAEVVDRFGIRWFLSVPQHRPPDDFTPEDYEEGAAK